MMANMGSRFVAIGLLAAAACGDSPKGRTYFERNIQPILTEKCAGTTSGCHAIARDPVTGEEDPFAFVAGNLDVTSFENISKRRDALTSFGAFPFPLLLIKAVGPDKLQFEYQGTIRPISVQHSGGGLIELGSDAYFTLQTWLDNGATENGLRPDNPPIQGPGNCTKSPPASFDAAAAAAARAQPGFASFKSTVQPILQSHNCYASGCHGAPQSDFFITCGDDDDSLAFNFMQTWSFVHDTGTPGAPQVLDSQLLRVPLAATSGSRFHTGGGQFASIDDPDFVALKTWAESVGELPYAMNDPLRRFFADNVQPIFVQRGCAFQACHSPQATNDFKLRSGAVGFFSSISLERNYLLFRNEFMALEFPDARRGRAVAKAILEDDPRVPTGVGGIVHRGGAVLDTPGPGSASDQTTCPAHPFDPATTTTTPFCIVQEWLTREREALITAGQATDFGTAGAKIVFVERPAASTGNSRLEFDTFKGGATLKAVNANFNALGVIADPIDISGATDISAACPGLAGGGDIQWPNVANDGDRVVFAGRATANDPLSVYVLSLSTGTCQVVTPAAPDSNGLKVHNFDPVFSPDGEYVVFASTRGKTGVGAVKSRKRFLPQSDLWRIKISGLTADQASLEQMTFLSNSEVTPSFMREGRVTMTTEKTSQGFYQLSGRRLNWDLTDYHPLLAQRKDSRFNDVTMTDLTSTNPSIGFSSATDITESSDGDFLVILSDVDPTTGAPAVPGAAGALGLFNRSIGPFEAGRTDVGYLQSLRILDGDGTTAAGPGYRRPRILPDGRIMVSFAPSASGGAFSIVTVDPRTGTRSPLLTNGTGAQVDAVLAFKRPPGELYINRRQLVFGGGLDSGGQTVLYMPDAPMIFTMLVANLRRGRPIEDFSRARFVEVFSEGECPAGNCSANAGGIFENRSSLGRIKLASDGSMKANVPSATGLVFRLVDGDGNEVALMGEEHQFGPGEQISMGVRRELFDGICGGCHGSVSAREIDVAVSPDALTGASQSVSLTAAPVNPN